MDQTKGSTPSGSTEPSSTSDTALERTWDWVIVMPWLTFGLAGVVALLSIVPTDKTNETSMTLWTTGALLALAAGMVVWFVRAFTFSLPIPECPLRTLYRRQIFIFAYAFTFISFVVVTMPAPDLFGVQQGSKKLAPVTMFYGCFDYGNAYADTPIPRCDRKDAKTGAATPPDPKVREHYYAFLLALGGSAAELRYTNDNQHVYAVSGGLVLPVYIVLVAMIGGAISLSRRIPEIQKRAEPDFPGTPEQTPLQMFEAREQVVFQIMQLIAAPFIAICSFHMFQPKDTASAVALAFASGFASETILLMIRGIVDGIRPGIPRTLANVLQQKEAAPAISMAGTSLTGQVLDKNRAPIADATVWVDGSLIRVKSDAAGKFVLSNVSLGAAMLRGQTSDGSLEGMMKLTVAANSKPELILS